MTGLVLFDLDAARHGNRTGNMANAGFQYLSNLDHRPLKLAGMTIALPKPLIRENLAERFGDDRHHAHEPAKPAADPAGPATAAPRNNINTLNTGWKRRLRPTVSGRNTKSSRRRTQMNSTRQP